MAARQIEFVIALKDGYSQALKAFSDDLQKIQPQFTAIAENSQKSTQKITGFFKALLDEIASANRGLQSFSFGLNNLTFGFQSLKTTTEGIFNSILGSSIRLQEQLLTIQTTIAAFTDVSRGGKNIADPLEKIKSLEPAVQGSLSRIRQASLELAGITSDELVGVYQAVTSNIGQINGNLKDAEKLAINFSAAMSTLKIPISDANVQIRGILQGQGVNEFTLARQLGLTTQIIEREKARNNLAGFLNQQLQIYVAGQGLVAKTFSGVSSNIVEVLDRVKESIGNVVLPPLVAWLDSIQILLLANREKIEDFFGGIAKGFLISVAAVGRILEAIAPLAKVIGQVVLEMGGLLASIASPFFAIFAGALETIAGVIASVLTPVVGLLSSDFGRFALTAIAVTAAINLLAPVIIGVATAFGSVAIGAFAIGLTGVIVATQGLIGVFAVLQISMSAFAAGLLLTVGIIGGLVVAVTLAVGIFGAYEDAMRAARQANESYAAATKTVVDQVDREIKKLDELKEARKKGTLTPEQLKIEQERKKALEQSTKAIENQIATLQKAKEDKALFGFGDTVNIQETDKQIASLTSKLKESREAIDNFGASYKAALDQGSIASQLQSNVEGATNKLVKNQGTLQELASDAKRLQANLKEAYETGQVSSDRQIEGLKLVAQNNSLLATDRIAAQKQITSVIQEEAKLQAGTQEAKIKEIESLAKGGSLSEVAAIEQVTAARVKSKQIELDAVRKAILAVDPNNSGSVEGIRLRQQEKTLQADLATIQVDSFRQRVDAQRKVLESELSANKQLRERAEIDLQGRLLKLRQTGFDSERDLSLQSLKLKQQSTESALKDKEKEIMLEKAILAGFKGSQEEKAKQQIKITQLILESAKLQNDLTQDQIAKEKLLSETRIFGLNLQKTSLESISKLLGSQNDLRQASVGLEKAIAEGAIKTKEIRIKGLQEAQTLVEGTRSAEQKQQNEDTKAQLAAAIALDKQRLARERLAQLGLASGSTDRQIAEELYKQEVALQRLKARQFEADQIAAKNQLEFQIQQREIQNQQLSLEAKITLEKAKQSKDKEAIASAELLVGLTDKQIENNKAIAAEQRKTLGVQQETQREGFNESQRAADFSARQKASELGVVGKEAAKGIFASEAGAGATASVSGAAATLNATLADSSKPANQLKNTLSEVAETVDKATGKIDKMRASLIGASEVLLTPQQSARLSGSQTGSVRVRSLFTGGLADAGEIVNVNEQGRESATDLETGARFLLPDGDRLLTFQNPTYIHNAADTAKMISLPPNSLSGEFERLAIAHENLLWHLRQQPKIPSTIESVVNFSNDPNPDRTWYDHQRQLMRIGK